MSEFSSVLSRHVHEKDIKTYSLAQYCGLDRSNMYKIINGKRKPTSLKMVHKMARFMRLSPAECQELEDAYHITLVGSDNYYRRKDVMDLFAEFNLSTVPAPSFHYRIEQVSDSRETMLLVSPAEVKQALFHIISAEMSCRTDGHIQLLLQPDASFLINLICAESQGNTDIHIEHIICLNNNPNTAQFRKNYNLNCLKQILPLYGNYRNYECFYYYDNVSAKTGEFTLFPYMIITSQYVCLLTAALDRGYVMRSAPALKMFTDIFCDCRKTSSVLIKQIGNVTEQLNYTESFLSKCGTSFCFQMMPCFTPFITLSMAEKYIKIDSCDRPVFINRFAEYIKQLNIWHEKNKTYFIFSYDGVKRFLANGRIDEYPEDVYLPFSIHDRVFLVKKLIQSCKKTHYRMLKNSIGSPENGLYLFSGRQNGYLMFLSPHTRQPVYLDIEEPGLLFTFYDFCENLEDDMFYTSEEADLLLNDLIKKVK